MNFSTPDKVDAVLTAGEDVENMRAENRVKVNKVFDGFPPLSAEQAKKMNVRVNVNWLEAKVIEQQACGQYYSAFTRQRNFFKIAVPTMPPDKRTEWEMQATSFINTPMKRNRQYYELIRSKFASVARHGIGPQGWLDGDDDGWLPKFIAIEDLRIATDTETNLENLLWYGVRKRYLPGELAMKAFGKNADPGWHKPTIAKILDNYKDVNNMEVSYDWETAPEKMLDLYKQDLGYWMSDAVPSATVWHFYYLDEDEMKKGRKKKFWKMKVIPAQYGILGLEKNSFLYESDEPVGDDLSQLLHIQFGDLNGKPPFMYHSVRALGFLLTEPCFWINLTRCRLIQHVWENFNMLLRGGDPSDRARTQKVELFDKGWVPQEVAIVPREQRHQIDPQLVETVMSQMKQLMQESSAAYTQDLDTGTQKERTAYEVMTVMNSVNQMMVGLLSTAAQYETFAYREICRRFCNRKSLNADIREFQTKWKCAQIPLQYMDHTLWEITPDMPLGAGNQTLELAQAQQLMQNRGAYDGEAQQEILNLFTAAVTNSAERANQLAPVGEQNKVTDAKRDAEFAFGTLMQGVPVQMKPGLNPIDQMDTLIGLTAGVIHRLEQAGGTATEQEVAGLGAVLQYMDTLMKQLAQDPQQKPRLKQYSDDISQLANQVKAFGQRLAAAKKSTQKESISINYKDAPPDIKRQMEAAAGFQPSQDQEAQVDPKMAKAMHGMAIKDAQTRQKMNHDQAGFEAEQARKDLETNAELHRKGLEHGQDIALQSAKAAAEPKEEKSEDNS